MKTLEELCTPKEPKTKDCATHGEYQARWMIGDAYSRCPLCEEDARAERERREDAERQASLRTKRRKLLEASGIGPRYLHATFDAYHTDTPEQHRNKLSAQDAVLALLQREERSLVLSGRAGTGKTHLASAMVLALIERGVPAVYCTMSQLCEDVRFGWRDGLSTRDVRERYHQPRLLVVDEMNELISEPQHSRAFFDVIDSRYQAKLSTVLITNESPSELSKMMDSRIYDRFREQGTSVLMFAGESVRGVIKNKEPKVKQNV